jgi:hypothetical protein
MKKYLMLMVAAASIATATFAQAKEKDEKHEKREQANVPSVVKQAFAKQYPGITAEWTKEDGNYEANFKHMNHEMSALFDANGAMTESEMEIAVKELPAAVTSYIKQHHKGAGIKEAAKITKANGEVNYEAEVKGADLIFDASGKFIKEIKG